MPMINSFGVIGGDERMRYLAASIAADGYPVCAYGFENSGPIRGVAETSLPDLVKRSAVILLPLPATRDGETLLAPLREIVRKECFGGEKGDVPEIRTAVLGNDAGMIGAAGLL